MAMDTFRFPDPGAWREFPSAGKARVRLLGMAGLVMWIGCIASYESALATGSPGDGVSSPVLSRLVNRLGESESPYLRERSDQPVAWQLWSAEAFDVAARLGRPVFLDLGVTWSDWGRRMDRENYRDTSVAARLNESFVCVRVDADERPDLDRRYRRLYALQTRDRGGGHPLLLFLTPRGDLFFGTSFLPREDPSGQGRDFSHLVEGVADLWSGKRETIEEEARRLTEIFAQLPYEALRPNGPITSATLESVHRAVVSDYSPRYPGFGPPEGPRFPSPWALRYLLAHGLAKRDTRDLSMVRSILRAMWEGAIVDPLEGGIHRYTIDGRWRFPRFEKLLDVNASHLWMLSLAQLVMPHPVQDAELRMDGSFLLKRLGPASTGAAGEKHERNNGRSVGGFASSIGSTPPTGEPSQYWEWSRADLESFLPPDGVLLAGLLWGIPEAERGTPEFETRYPLRRAMDLDVASRYMLRYSLKELASLRDEVQSRLLEARGDRPEPTLDARRFTAPNARMIQALWTYADATWESGARETAREIAEHFEANARRIDGLMAHRVALLSTPASQGGVERSREPGGFAPIPFLEDQSAWIAALLESHAATGEQRWLRRAEELTEATLAAFRDPSGFLLTDRLSPAALRGTDDPTTGPVAVPVIVYEDEGMPGPVSEMALNLAILWRSTGEQRWREEAERLLNFAAFAVEYNGRPYTTWAYAAELLEEGISVHVVGGATDPKTQELLRVVRSVQRPYRVIAVHERGENLPWAGNAFAEETIPFAYVVGRKASAAVRDAKVLEDLARTWER